MNWSTKKLALAAVIGAVYAALTMLLAPISYGSIQFRLSEALCVLPFFFPWSAWGLFVGCIIANLISAAGLPDVVFGSLATLLAALCVARIGRPWRQGGGTRPPAIGGSIAACLMPVLFNGPIVGAVLAYAAAPESGDTFFALFALIGAQVAFGEAVVMLVLGLPLIRYLPRSEYFRMLSNTINCAGSQ